MDIARHPLVVSRGPWSCAPIVGLRVDGEDTTIGVPRPLTQFGPASNFLFSRSSDPLVDNAMNQPIDDLLLDTELTLESLEKSDNQVLKRVAERLLDKRPDSVVAGHSSHSSSSGRGHTSYVTGRFEDAPGTAS